MPADDRGLAAWRDSFSMGTHRTRRATLLSLRHSGSHRGAFCGKVLRTQRWVRPISFHSETGAADKDTLVFPHSGKPVFLAVPELRSFF